MLADDPLELDPNDIEARGVVRTPEGAIVSRVGVLLSIYFLEGWRKDKRQGLSSILEEYLSRFADKVTHYQKEDARGMTRWDGQGLPEPYRALAGIGEDDEFWYNMKRHDLKQSADPSLFRIMAFGFAVQNTTRPLSGLKAHFPPSYVFADPDRFAEMVRAWCGRLDAAHGSAGLGVLTVPGRETTEKPYHYPLLCRYPALEYDAMGDYWVESCRSGFERPRSSNWLTILGRDNVNALDGVQAIQAKLGADMTLAHYERGIILRAGRLPALGDGRTHTVPEGYRIAAHIIKPIRFEAYESSILKVPEPLEGVKETLKWIRRFD